MKRKIIILVLVIMIVLVSVNILSTQEQGVLGYISGNKYLELLENDKMVYVCGLTDMWWQMHYDNFPEFYQVIKEKMKDMTGAQIKKIFEKYLEEHPEKLHLGAAGLFNTAIIEKVL